MTLAWIRGIHSALRESYSGAILRVSVLRLAIA
jgi:hypothetical protein